MTDDFCILLEEAIKDEVKAPSDYERIKKAREEYDKRPDVPKTSCHLQCTLTFNNLIDSIIADEKKHRENLKKLHEVFC